MISGLIDTYEIIAGLLTSLKIIKLTNSIPCKIGARNFANKTLFENYNFSNKLCVFI